MITDLLERLKQLCRLANNNPNEHEANLAARRATELLAKHNYKIIKEEVRIREQVKWIEKERPKNPIIQTTEDPFRHKLIVEIRYDELNHNSEVMTALRRLQNAVQRHAQEPPIWNPTPEQEDYFRGTYAGINRDNIGWRGFNWNPFEGEPYIPRGARGGGKTNTYSSMWEDNIRRDSERYNKEAADEEKRKNDAAREQAEKAKQEAKIKEEQERIRKQRFGGFKVKTEETFKSYTIYDEFTEVNDELFQKILNEIKGRKK